MSNRLIISELSYLEDITRETSVIAGYAFVNTFTTTGTGFSGANAVALALGAQTSTNTQTFAKVQSYGNFSFSYADATASAFAQTGYNSDRAWSSSTSLSFSS
jgi:hypothetical protein